MTFHPAGQQRRSPADRAASTSRTPRRRSATAVTTAAAVLALSAPAASAWATGPYPETITLPNDLVAGDIGFQPEGIAIAGSTAYVGSFADGTIVSVDLRSGTTRPLVAADGEPTSGVEVAGPLLLAAGVASGEVRAYDRRTGEQVAVRDIAAAGLVNDITIAGGTAYFTDSFRAAIYAVPVAGRTVGEPREIPLTGDFTLATSGVGLNANGVAINANGVAALDSDTLVLAQTDDPDGVGSALYVVDTNTGATQRIVVEGGDVAGADGLVLRGRTLWVVQYDSDSIAELRLSADGSSAKFVRTLRDEDLVVPTTADIGPRGDLYAVNARFFRETPTDSVTYEVVRVQR